MRVESNLVEVESILQSASDDDLLRRLADLLGIPDATHARARDSTPERQVTLGAPASWVTARRKSARLPRLRIHANRNAAPGSWTGACGEEK